MTYFLVVKVQKNCKNTLSCYGKLKTRKEALQKLSRNPSTDLNCIFQSWQDQRHLKSWTHMEDMEFNSILVSRQTRVVLVHLRHVLLVSRLCICTHGRASTSSLTICRLLSQDLPLMMKEICGWIHVISLHCTVPHYTSLLKKKTCHVIEIGWIEWSHHEGFWDHGIHQASCSRRAVRLPSWVWQINPSFHVLHARSRSLPSRKGTPFRHHLRRPT